MYSWLAWALLTASAAMLGGVGFHFSIRTVRWVAFLLALTTAAYLVVYGIAHPAHQPGSLSGAFARGADALSGALLRPLTPGHHVPVPGRIGWLVIGVLVVLGYRTLEAWTLRRQAPTLDVSALAGDRQDEMADAGPAAQTGRQLHAWLVAELKFRLPAVQVRSPAILPGGSRPSELASIAEATGVNGAGLAGAIIRFFGMIWPSPPRIQVRAWVERTPGQASVDGVTQVSVSLADPRSGASIANKTLAGGSLDDATAAVAGYVARHVFARDPTVPPWSASATDGGDLAALLCARQVRGYPECRTDVRGAWEKQIEILEGVARRDMCAGVVRYELAQLYDLIGKHEEALLLHAANREQYSRFYRGRYRLAMSLEMIANPESGLAEIDMATLKKALRILVRCGVIEDILERVPDAGRAGVPDCLRPFLLAAAWQELEAIQRYLTWRHIIWSSFWRRNERAVLKPFWRRPRHRQAFHDGVRIGQLLVAVRQALPPEARAGSKLRHAATVARIVAAISQDSHDFRSILPVRTARQLSITARQSTRHWPRQCSTPSWPAAYSLACAYSAIAFRADTRADTSADARADARAKPDPLISKVIRSLEFAIFNPECEMERPSEWISNDPDFSWLSRQADFAAFLEDQRNRDYPVSDQPASAGSPAEPALR